jgi:hypothetical protein
MEKADGQVTNPAEELDAAFGAQIGMKLSLAGIATFEQLATYRGQFAKIRGIGRSRAAVIESVFSQEDRVREVGALALNSLAPASRRRVLSFWMQSFTKPEDA